MISWRLHHVKFFNFNVDKKFGLFDEFAISWIFRKNKDIFSYKLWTLFIFKFKYFDKKLISKKSAKF